MQVIYKNVLSSGDKEKKHIFRLEFITLTGNTIFTYVYIKEIRKVHYDKILPEHIQM